MYYPTVTIWRLGLSRLGHAALTGVVAAGFYASYDIIGAKFLWWTWHDTDLPISNRLLGVPIGSTMWVVTFVAAFSYLLSWGRAGSAGAGTYRGLAAAVLLSTSVMALQMQLLQPLDGGVPGARGLAVVCVIYLLIAAHQARRRQPGFHDEADKILRAGASLYFAVLMFVMAAFDPATHESASMHQIYGPCHVEAEDLLGFTRYEFVCAEDFDEDYTFTCAAELPAAYSEWYTVCGRPHREYARFMGAVAGLGICGILLFSWLLRRKR
jgi:hypothetical protein